MFLYGNIIRLIDKFLQSYETATEISRRKAYPYNPNIIKYIRSLPKEKQEQIKKSLLKYCELDTYAMVKIWQKLNDVIKEKS